MRIYDKVFIINSSGKAGTCIAYSFKTGVLYLALRVDDRIEVVTNQEVRIHPDEMAALEADLAQIIAFRREHDND